MRKRVFGNTGIEVPVLGQGTWQIRDEKAAAEALAVGLELGMTHIDTAELYRGAEQVIAPVIKGRRDDVFLVSKVMPRNASRRGTIEACEKSLARAGTDHFDVYLLHWWDDDHPIEDTMAAMGELVDRGMIRAVGVSNFDVHELEAAQSALGSHRLACNQVLYHLGERGIESDVLPWCAEHGVAIVGYSPFGSGNFPKPASVGGKVLQAVADERGLTPRQVALAFLSRDENVFLIPKAEKAAHVRENAGGDFVLRDAEVAAIDAVFPMRPGIRFL